MDALLKAKLAELAAAATVANLKAERNQFFDNREMVEELSRLSRMANDLVASAKK